MGSDGPTHQVCFLTLGCVKNETDTDRMRALIEASHTFECIDDPDKADIVIVNTCSFLVAAVEEGIDVVLSLVAERTTDGITRPVVMTGCIPSRYGTDIISEMPEIAAFVPVDEEDRIVDVLEKVCGISHAPEAPQPPVARTVQAPYAYIKISDGCDRYCSFCAIPFIRGRYYSRTEEEILSEVSYLIDGGVREIVLIGQDTGVWGSDLPGTPTVASLLRSVAHLLEPVNGWVRILYLQPEGLTDELIATIRDVKEVVPYIDMPLQHASSSVLQRMNRSGDKESFLELVARLRREIPGITLRTTALVGFPGETDEDFDELVDFLYRAAFDYCAVFSYSQEEGTVAADLPNQIPEDIKLQRTQRIIDISEECGFASAAERIDSHCRVLVDGIDDDGYGSLELIGRAPFQAPDSDGVVHLGSLDAEIGDFIDVLIDDAACYELFAAPPVSHEEGSS